MIAFQEFWQGLTARARTGLVAGALFIAALTVWLSMQLLRVDYQILFSDLAAQDAAAMTAELDKMKVPYRLGQQGAAILVPVDQVYKTRLALAGRDLPLQGSVGFELFNSSEVGMTEFTQKVNYQRALQGELTRTILALDEVKGVRVHLVLGEQGLFRKTAKQAKASISLATKPGRALSAEQVQGIQRLVSAAVPDIRPGDVTIVDQRGVALTARAPVDGEDAGVHNLDDKRALETLLQKKVDAVLERALGPNQAIATIDVTLVHEQRRVTTERVLRADGGAGEGAAGVKVREKVTTQNAGTDANDPVPQPAGPGNRSSNRETDYQVGRQVEQTVSGAGGIGRISVAVVVNGSHDADDVERLKDVVARAAGMEAARGDAVSIVAIDPRRPLDTASAMTPSPTPEDSTPRTGGFTKPARSEVSDPALVIGTLLALIVLAAGGFAWDRQRRARQYRLDETQRRAVLNQVQQWLTLPAHADKEKV